MRYIVQKEAKWLNGRWRKKRERNQTIPETESFRQINGSLFQNEQLKNWNNGYSSKDDKTRVCRYNGQFFLSCQECPTILGGVSFGALQKKSVLYSLPQFWLISSKILGSFTFSSFSMLVFWARGMSENPGGHVERWHWVFSWSFSQSVMIKEEISFSKFSSRMSLYFLNDMEAKLVLELELCSVS